MRASTLAPAYQVTLAEEGDALEDIQGGIASAIAVIPGYAATVTWVDDQDPAQGWNVEISDGTSTVFGPEALAVGHYLLVEPLTKTLAVRSNESGEVDNMFIYNRDRH